MIMIIVTILDIFNTIILLVLKFDFRIIIYGLNIISLNLNYLFDLKFKIYGLIIIFRKYYFDGFKLVY